MAMIIPHGFMRIDDAIELIGKELFVDAWLGTELKSRSGLLNAEQRYAWARERHEPAGSLGRFNWRAFPPYALKEFEAEGYPLEQEARVRLDAARAELHRRLEAGTITACSVNPNNGFMTTLIRDVWRRNDAKSILETGVLEIKNYGNTLTKKIFIARDWPKPAVVHRLESLVAAPTPPSDRTGAPGAPSSSHLVEAEFKRRCSIGEIEASLVRQADVLARWLRETHPLLRPMTAKAVENNLRTLYRNAKQGILP